MAASLAARAQANTGALSMPRRHTTSASTSSTKRAKATYESFTKNETSSPALVPHRGMSASDTTTNGSVNRARTRMSGRPFDTKNIPSKRHPNSTVLTMR